MDRPTHTFDLMQLEMLALNWLQMLVCLSSGVMVGFSAMADPLLGSSDRDESAEPLVLIAEHPDSMDQYHPNAEVVGQMFQSLLLATTGESTVSEAWAHFILPDDRVGFKILSEPGRLSGTRPAVVEAVISSLLSTGFPPDQVVIWDRRLGSLMATGYQDLAQKLRVKLAGAQDAGYDDSVFHEAPLVGSLVFGDHEFGKDGEGVGRRSFVSNLVTQELTRLIVIHPMLNHYLGGVHGNLVGLVAASVDNFHRFLIGGTQYYQAVPEIFAMEALYDKLAFVLCDGLICQYQGEDRGFLQYSNLLHRLMIGVDPVAMDVLSFGELSRLRHSADLPVDEKIRLLYENAQLLELGMADSQKIRSQYIQLPSILKNNGSRTLQAPSSAP